MPYAARSTGITANVAIRRFSWRGPIRAERASSPGFALFAAALTAISIRMFARSAVS